MKTDVAKGDSPGNDRLLFLGDSASIDRRSDQFQRGVIAAYGVRYALGILDRSGDELRSEALGSVVVQGNGVFLELDPGADEEVYDEARKAYLLYNESQSAA